jgi:hypothetical protein
MPKIIRDGQELTWTCHICGQERPDDKISVEQHKVRMPGTNQQVMENVRYCNDKAECANAAPEFSFLTAVVPITATRRRQMPGVSVPKAEDER